MRNHLKCLNKLVSNNLSYLVLQRGRGLVVTCLFRSIFHKLSLLLQANFYIESALKVLSTNNILNFSTQDKTYSSSDTHIGYMGQVVPMELDIKEPIVSFSHTQLFFKMRKCNRQHANMTYNCFGRLVLYKIPTYKTYVTPCPILTDFCKILFQFSLSCAHLLANR